MKVIIAGSRIIADLALVKRAVKESGFKITTVVSGCARGVDKLGEQMAKELGVPVERYPADWLKYGRSAGAIRNSQMAKAASALVAVWRNSSPGTDNMISNMRLLGKPVYVLKV